MTHQPGVYVPLRALFSSLRRLSFIERIVVIYPEKVICIEGRAFNLPFVIHFFNVMGVTIRVALQISVMYNMYKMSKTSSILCKLNAKL